MTNAIQSDEKRDEQGRFIVPPVSPGRPKGSRNKLGEAFLSAVHDDFAEHGVKAVQDAREKDPLQYCRMIAGLLPSEHTLNINKLDDLSDAELSERLRQLTEAIAPFIGDGGGVIVGDAEGATGRAITARVH